MLPNVHDWWNKPRKISVVVDNPSWILPYIDRLINEINFSGDNATLYSEYSMVSPGDVAFFLGCIKIAPARVLQQNKRNLVCHASDLPKGRGFSPSSWAILEGKNSIPVCLLEAVEAVDAGRIIYKEEMILQGHELSDEVRHIFGNFTVNLCLRFLSETTPQLGIPQEGEPSFYPRRRPKDNRLDIDKSLREQFNLLRIVDNERYPAYFENLGHFYKLSIEKIEPI